MWQRYVRTRNPVFCFGRIPLNNTLPLDMDSSLAAPPLMPPTLLLGKTSVEPLRHDLEELLKPIGIVRQAQEARMHIYSRALRHLNPDVRDEPNAIVVLVGKEPSHLPAQLVHFERRRIRSYKCHTHVFLHPSLSSRHSPLGAVLVSSSQRQCLTMTWSLLLVHSSMLFVSSVFGQSAVWKLALEVSRPFQLVEGTAALRVGLGDVFCRLAGLCHASAREGRTWSRCKCSPLSMLSICTDERWTSYWPRCGVSSAQGIVEWMRLIDIMYVPIAATHRTGKLCVPTLIALCDRSRPKVGNAT